MAARPRIADSMLELIGDIPLVRLNRVGRGLDAEILVKPEYLNPSGSMKDRVALRMVERAESTGALRPGGRLVESTTGNTGAALAFVAAVKGYRFAAFVPDSVASGPRLDIMRSYGAEVQTFDDADAPDDPTPGDLRGRAACRDLEAEGRGDVWVRQFDSAESVAAHRETTGREILEQTGGRLDAFVTSVGSGGLLLGVGQALKAHDPAIRVVGVQPSASPAFDGRPAVPGLSGGILHRLEASGLVDEVIDLDDPPAVAMARRLAREEGMFCGVSSGANVEVALRLARRLGPGARVVAILCDSRDRYLEREAYTT